MFAIKLLATNLHIKCYKEVFMLSVLTSQSKKKQKEREELERKLELYKQLEKVIVSCKTSEQLEVAFNWAERVFAKQILLNADPYKMEQLALELALFFKRCSVKLLESNYYITGDR